MSTITPYSQPQGWSPAPSHSTYAKVLEIIGIALGAAGIVVMIDTIAKSASAGSTVTAGLLAFIPLVFVAAAIMWVDRWEPEPRSTLLFAFVWGAGVCTMASLYANTILAELLYLSDVDYLTQLAISSAVGAPIIEEVTKGVGVLLIFFLGRRHFDGPLDGFVYAATVAAGFAFVENILYFAQYADEIGSVFVGRGVMSPFAHIVFTGMIGLMLGVAARSQSWFSWLWHFPLGLAMAVALHALWNFSTLSDRYVVLYVLLQVPMFIVGTAMVYWLRHLERGVLQHRLGEYMQAGWFSPGEVHMLTSLAERRRAREWAAQRGRKDQMKAFQKGATDLAYMRERLSTGRATASSGADQHELLRAVTAARAEIFA